MSWATSEIVAVLAFLLPGFVGAAAFYSLTSHPKPSEFDRVVQALVFTTVGQAIAWLIQVLAEVWTVYQWPAGFELAVAIASAVAVALVAVYCSNHDVLHGLLRRIGVTAETSYPSELYSAFVEHLECYVVLHLKGERRKAKGERRKAKGERRLYGWVEEWPSRPPDGHFRITEAVWLDEEQQSSPVRVIAILVPARDVEVIEFVQI